MTGPISPRPGRGAAAVAWTAIALAIYGIAAIFGLGGLTDAVADVPGHGVLGGFFVGLAVFAIPSVGGWALGRPLGITPVFPRASAVVVWIGMIGMTAIGLLAILIDVGLLDLVPARQSVGG